MSVDKRMDASTSRRRDGQAERRIGRWKDRRTDKQTERDSQADEQPVRVEGIIEVETATACLSKGIIRIID